MLPAAILWISCGGNEPEPKPEPKLQPETVSVTGVTLNKTTLTLDIGASETLTATVAPSDATNKAVVWSSSNGAVASVDNAGKVTAAAEGTTTITVITAEGSKSATCEVTVNPKTVTGVSLDKTTLSLVTGDSETLTATVTPVDAANENVTWSSSDATVATVDGDGKITAIAKGVVTITVTTEDGGKTATCEVTVEAKFFVEFQFNGKDYRIANDNTCIFTRYSDEYYVVECSDAATKQALSISIAKKLEQGLSYDIYSSAPYITSDIKLLFTEGETIAEEILRVEDISQRKIIGKLTITELTDNLLSGTFNCLTTNGEITEGTFTVKAREWE